MPPTEVKTAVSYRDAMRKERLAEQWDYMEKLTGYANGSRESFELKTFAMSNEDTDSLFEVS